VHKNKALLKPGINNQQKKESPDSLLLKGEIQGILYIKLNKNNYTTKAIIGERSDNRSTPYTDNFYTIFTQSLHLFPKT